MLPTGRGRLRRCGRCRRGRDAGRRGLRGGVSATGGGLGWIGVAPDAPYFMDEAGAAWHPIGQNDSVDWIDLAGLYRQRDLAGVEAHLRWLKAHGVTCLRLMLEDARGRHRYFERPAGRFVPAMVQLWDDLFALCEAIGLRILLTPLDTFWTWIRWRHHPWNRAHGGPLDRFSRVLICPDARAAWKARLDFAIGRWGGSGALFAWDLWNEIHPANAEDSADCFDEVIHDLSSHVRREEQRRFGRSHLQTVSLYGPELRWKPHVPMTGPIFRHPDLDFATIHIYRERSIDDPRDTVAPALAMAEIVRSSLAEIEDGRPFLDTEHGPIHAFKDRRITLPEPFDDEYFRHLAWAHLAAGGAGGGMRWPNRHPHRLTAGMRLAQKAMADFMPLIDWTRFRRRPLDLAMRGAHAIGCGDGDQALVWLVRRGGIRSDGQLGFNLPPVRIDLAVPLAVDHARVVAWDTARGTALSDLIVPAQDGAIRLTGALDRDCAFAIVGTARNLSAGRRNRASRSDVGSERRIDRAGEAAMHTDKEALDPPGYQADEEPRSLMKDRPTPDAQDSGSGGGNRGRPAAEVNGAVQGSGTGAGGSGAGEDYDTDPVGGSGLDRARCGGADQGEE